MSIQVNSYLMFGYKFQGDALQNRYIHAVGEEAFSHWSESLWDNAYKPQEPGTIVLVSDSMNGDYDVLGVVMHRTDQYEQNMFNFPDMKPTAKMKRTLKKFVETLPVGVVLPGMKPEVLLFTNFR